MLYNIYMNIYLIKLYIIFVLIITIIIIYACFECCVLYMDNNRMKVKHALFI